MTEANVPPRPVPLTRTPVRPGVSCDDDDPCTVDSCTDEEGCTHDPVQYGSGQTYDPDTGNCIFDVCLEPAKGYSSIATQNAVTTLQGSFTSQQCCNVCWNTPGCAVWALGIGNPSRVCFIAPQAGATEVGQCPLGEQTILYNDGSALWNTGPCGVPNH